MEVPAKLRSAVVGIRYWLFALLFLATSTLLISCNNGSSVILVGPGSITITVPADTTTNPNDVVEVTATVVDDNGDPLDGMTVEFALTNNNSAGSLSAPSAVTDSEGQAFVDYTAGPKSDVTDTITAQVTLEGPNDLEVSKSTSVDITVEPVPVGSIAVNSGISVLVANGVSNTLIRATALDKNNNPSIGTSVSFTTTLGSLSGTTAPTDSDGIAEVFLTAGIVPGTATVIAAVPGFSDQVQVTFVTDAPDSIDVSALPDSVFSDGQTTITATVKDENENPIEGETIIFSIETNDSGGSLGTPPSAVTNVNGEASINYTAGSSTGTDTIKARSASNEGLSDTVEVDVVVVIVGAVVVDSGDMVAGTGTLELGLTDASTEDYQAVYVTVAEVQVKKQDQEVGEAGWETVMTPEQTYNLLELVNGVIATLGVGELEAGQYGQLRLILGELPEFPETNILGDSHPYANYLIDSEDNAIELTVPSGYQTGIKIVKDFAIVASQATELILDFDAARSVVQAGKSGKYLLKSTIKVLETVENSVSGVVNDWVDPIGRASVSAQIYDSAADPKDEVTMEATTVSTEEGAFKLFLPPDTYNIVAFREGYLPACQELEAQFFEEYIADFSLVAETGIITISGTVSGLATEEDSALLSIRQTIDCGSEDVTIEVASISLAEGGNYSITLPADTYDVVASAAGETTQVFEDINAATELDIVFDL